MQAMRVTGKEKESNNLAHLCSLQANKIRKLVAKLFS
jgi:hypothetical protein